MLDVQFDDHNPPLSEPGSQRFLDAGSRGAGGRCGVRCGSSSDPAASSFTAPGNVPAPVSADASGPPILVRAGAPEIASGCAENRLLKDLSESWARATARRRDSVLEGRGFAETEGWAADAVTGVVPASRYAICGQRRECRRRVGEQLPQSARDRARIEDQRRSSSCDPSAGVSVPIRVTSVAKPLMVPGNPEGTFRTAGAASSEGFDASRRGSPR